MDGPSLHQHIRPVASTLEETGLSSTPKSPHVSQQSVSHEAPIVSEPAAPQQTFEQVPSYGTSQFRRLTVTSLLLVANLVQVGIQATGRSGKI